LIMLIEVTLQRKEVCDRATGMSVVVGCWLLPTTISSHRISILLWW
jgi:hypothetical protein